MTYKGGELGERAGICMCVAGSLCCTTEGNTALSINYTLIKLKKIINSQRRNLEGRRLGDFQTPTIYFSDSVWVWDSTNTHFL